MFQPGNKLASGARPKPFAAALKMELAAMGDDFKALRSIASKLIAQADAGELAAIKELADRIDGKVPQGLQHSGEDGGAIETKSVSDFELARWMALELAKAAKAATKS